MQDVLMAGIIASATCLVSGPLLIPFLRRLKFGQHIRTDGPKGHLQKAGTPTMGGIMFFLSLTLGTLLVRGLTTEIVIMLLVTLGFGFIGFLDDFIKVVMKRPLGLKAREKLLGQIILAGLLAYAAMVNLGRGTEVLIPGTALSFSLSWLYIPFAIFVVVSASNAVNLTDGLDGLAAGVTLFSALAYLLITEARGLVDLSVFSGALVGTCLGFLFFNIHPARVFMGDTGSLALGGAIGALAVVTKTELLLPLLGGIYVLETLSVIIQVISFRLTGKRVFRMSPLHHHFELSGWSEQSVVLVFWTGAALFASIAVALVL